VSLFFRPEDRAKEPTAKVPFTRREVMEYISFAKKHVEPVLTDAACKRLVAGYVLMRRGNNPTGASGGGPAGRKTIAATTRQLESLVRLSEAHARMRLSLSVDELDVEEAVRLMDVSTQKAAVDPRTGTIDMNMISTGKSAGAADAVSMLVEALRELLGGRAPRERLSLGEVVKVLNAANPDMPEPGRQDLVQALRELADEDEPILVYGSAREGGIQITGNGLRVSGGDY